MSNSNHKVISDPSEGSICVAAGVGRNQCHYRITWIMINHSTLYISNNCIFIKMCCFLNSVYLLRSDKNSNIIVLNYIVGGQLSGGQLSGGQLSGGQLLGGQLSGGQLSGGQLSGVNCRGVNCRPPLLTPP